MEPTIMLTVLFLFALVMAISFFIAQVRDTSEAWSVGTLLATVLAVACVIAAYNVK